MNSNEIDDLLDDEAVIFSDPDFDEAIIGVSTDGRICYSYELMVEQFAQDSDVSEEEAADFIEYNTIRALGYAGNHAPIIVIGWSRCE